MNVLFIRLDHIGDCFLSLPAIKEFKEKFPHSKISILCKDNTKEIFASSGLIDETFTLNPFHSSNSYEKKSGFSKILKLWLILNSRNFDHIYNFRDHILERLFFLFIRGKYSSAIKKLMYHYDIHIIKRNRLMLGHAFDYRVSGEKDYVRLSNSNLSEEKKIKLKRLSQEKILFHIGGSYMKKLPMKRLHELLIVLKSERDDILPVKSSFDNFVFDNIEILNIDSILEWSYLCEKAKGCICFDSGPMHIAAGHSKRLFSIFGPTSVVYFGPRGDDFKVFRPLGYQEDFVPGMKFSFERFGSHLQEVEINVLKDAINDYFNKQL